MSAGEGSGMNRTAAALTLAEICQRFCFAADYFRSLGLESIDPDLPLAEALERLPEAEHEATGMTVDEIISGLVDYLDAATCAPEGTFDLHSLTLLGGRDKTGARETQELTVRPGDVISVVGPTGSGKSRLLEDIRFFAQNDTPTCRTILINGAEPTYDERLDLSSSVVSELSQHMHFVIDLPVGEFVSIHARSRRVEDPERVCAEVIAAANELSGEAFSAETPVTALSGGQSRALMIADTAIIGNARIILIDEIENAGIDRMEALNLLVKQGKIVFIATHDPLIALMGRTRIVLRNGGISRIVTTTPKERVNLEIIRRMDAAMMAIRTTIREGGMVDGDITKTFAGALEGAGEEKKTAGQTRVGGC